MRSQPATKAPPRHKLAVLTWLAIYPTITLVLAVLEYLGLTGVALPLRTLALTLLVVPLAVFVLIPMLTRAFRGWLRTDHSGGVTRRER
jgi:uncharacterized protein